MSINQLQPQHIQTSCFDFSAKKETSEELPILAKHLENCMGDLEAALLLSQEESRESLSK